MNKHFIVFLAVCLISVQAFVKRDAETAPSAGLPTLEDIKKKLEELNGQITDILNPEVIKKNVNEAIDTISKTINDMQAKQAPK